MLLRGCRFADLSSTRLGKGVTDRVQGAVGGMVAGAAGNPEAQKQFERQHDTGKTLQRGAESDIQKQNP